MIRWFCCERLVVSVYYQGVFRDDIIGYFFFKYLEWIGEEGFFSFWFFFEFYKFSVLWLFFKVDNYFLIDIYQVEV